MKRVFLLSILMMMSFSMLAGGVAQQRGKCGVFKKRFKTTSRVSKLLVPICIKSNASCNGISKYAPLVCNKPGCAFQEVWAGWDGLGAKGKTYHWTCSRGELFDDFSFQLFSTEATTEEEENSLIEESYLKIDKIDFNEEVNGIEFIDMAGYLFLKKGNRFKTSAKISIWKPEDDHLNQIEDTVFDSSKVLKEFEIILTDEGTYIANNLFPKSVIDQIVIEENNSEIMIDFNKVNYQLLLDSSISVEELSVRLETDGAPDLENNIEQISLNTSLNIENNDIFFKLYPNPTKDIINIEFKSFSDCGKTLIQVYDMSGTKIKDIFIGEIEKKSINYFEFNMNELTSGIYFIYIQDDCNNYIKKINKL